MNVIVCLDNDNGMAFNGRRQSRDRNVINDIIKSVPGILYMDSYSYRLFMGTKDNCFVLENFIENRKNNDVCFIENKCLNNSIPEINTITIYRWNRKYPGDLFFDINIEDNFEKISSIDFEGYSHERITKEVWKRVK